MKQTKKINKKPNDDNNTKKTISEKKNPVNTHFPHMWKVMMFSAAPQKRKITNLLVYGSGKNSPEKKLLM